jgi:hypothetical protein
MVCEVKNARLVTMALGSLQKMLAHDAVNAEGRKLIMQALVQVGRGRRAARACSMHACGAAPARALWRRRAPPAGPKLGFALPPCC